MKFSVRPALTTAQVVRGLDMDHDLRRGQRCTVLTRPVSLINRGKPVQINRATSERMLTFRELIPPVYSQRRYQCPALIIICALFGSNKPCGYWGHLFREGKFADYLC